MASNLESNNWEIILRNDSGRQVVLYNNQGSESEQTALFNSHGNRYCSLCHRPFANDDTQSSIVKESALSSMNYFRLLHRATKDLTYIDSSKRQFKIEYTSEETMPVNIISKDCLNQGYYKRFFIEKEKLGKGFRGSVYLCRHILDNIELGEYAIKKVPVGDNHTWLMRMLKEVNILEELRHPNIIDYKHAWIENHKMTMFGPEVPCLFILMELANGGNLETYVFHYKEEPERNAEFLSLVSTRKRSTSTALFLQETPSQMPFDLTLSLFYDICQGLMHLHKHNILHRDLKPSNLLLKYSADFGKRPTVLMSDFGECENFTKLNSLRTGGTGTLEFMAPELLITDEQGTYIGQHSTSSDIWSLGMILYFMCFASLPYCTIDNDDIMRDEIRHFKSIQFPALKQTDRRFEIFKFIISKCLQRDFKERPSIDVILDFLNANVQDIHAPIRRTAASTTEKPLNRVVSDHYGSTGSFKKLKIYTIVYLSIKFLIYIRVSAVEAIRIDGLSLGLFLSIFFDCFM